MCEIEKRSYNRIPDNEIIKYLSLYYKQEKLTFNRFCTIYRLSARRRSLERTFEASGAKKLKQSTRPCEEAVYCIKKYLVSRKGENTAQVNNLNKSKKYLTDDEESLVVSLTKMMSNMGLGIEKDTCLEIINACLLYTSPSPRD